MLKHFTGSTVKSYMIKFALNMTLLGGNPSSWGLSINKRVLSHWTMKDKFWSVHPDLRALGISAIEVGEKGIFFLRKDVGCSGDQKKMEEAEKAMERGTEAYIKEDFTEAISHYERALDIDSENYIHWGNLSAVMFKVQAFKEVCTDNNHHR